MQLVHASKGQRHGAAGSGKVVGDAVSNFVAEFASVFLAQTFNEYASIHACGAARTAQAVGSAGGLGHVFILFFELLQFLAVGRCFTQAAYFAVGGNALARRKREVA